MRSAPTKTLADALIKLGYRCRHADSAFAASTAWIKVLLTSDVVVLVDYGGNSATTLRRVATAAALGRPVVRWWVGSDVFEALGSESESHLAKRLDRLIARNIAVAPHLVDELHSIGIDAEYIPSVVDLPCTCDETRTMTVPPALLVYLPSARRDFYGERQLRPLIEANQDIHFYIVADDEHTLAHYQNVTSIGWADDMEGIWHKVGGLLRLTRHDGLPRMVIEALSRGKHVIYSWPLKGCWLARTFEEAQRAIDDFRAQNSPNLAGVIAAKSLRELQPEKLIAEILEAAVIRRPFRIRAVCSLLQAT